MDPDLQDDIDPTETFAGRLAGLDELRHSNTDWRDKAIDQALKAGDYLEKRFNQFQRETNQKVSEAASSKVQTDLILDVAILKNDSRRRQNTLAWVAGVSASLSVGLVLLVLEHWWK